MTADACIQYSDYSDGGILQEVLEFLSCEGVAVLVKPTALKPSYHHLQGLDARTLRNARNACCWHRATVRSKFDVSASYFQQSVAATSPPQHPRHVNAAAASLIESQWRCQREEMHSRYIINKAKLRSTIRELEQRLAEHELNQLLLKRIRLLEQEIKEKDDATQAARLQADQLQEKLARYTGPTLSMLPHGFSSEGGTTSKRQLSDPRLGMDMNIFSEKGSGLTNSQSAGSSTAYDDVLREKQILRTQLMDKQTELEQLLNEEAELAGLEADLSKGSVSELEPPSQQVEQRLVISQDISLLVSRGGDQSPPVSQRIKAWNRKISSESQDGPSDRRFTNISRSASPSSQHK